MRKTPDFKITNLMISKSISQISELPTCYACPSKDVKISYDDSNYRVLNCRRCGLYFVNPIPTIEDPKFNRSDVLYGARKELIQKEKEKVRARVTVSEVIKLSRHGKLRGNRLLDIGSGYGFFLKRLSERGWDVYGCEQNVIAKGHAEGMNLRVYQDLKHRDLWREDFYDVITMWNVLEHLDDPLGLLNDCHRLLNKGGCLVVRVPNIALDHILWKVAKLRGEIRPYMDVPIHLFGFTVSALNALMKRAGFINACLVPSPLGDYSFYLEKRFGYRKSQVIIKLVEYINLVFLRLSLHRSAGFLSITFLAQRPAD